MGKVYSKEDIERIANTDPELLTPQERGMKNLIPTMAVKGGPSTNPRGNYKRTPNLGGRIRKLMENEDFLKTILKSTPSQWKDIVDKTPGSIIAAGIVSAATKEIAKVVSDGKPVSKELRDLIDLLNKVGYGEKVVHEAGDSFFEKANINFNVISTPTLEEITGKNQDEEDEQDNENLNQGTDTNKEI